MRNKPLWELGGGNSISAYYCAPLHHRSVDYVPITAHPVVHYYLHITYLIFVLVQSLQGDFNYATIHKQYLLLPIPTPRCTEGLKHKEHILFAMVHVLLESSALFLIVHILLLVLIQVE